MVNIAAYKFVTLNDLGNLRARLFAECERLQIKGTILLAGEGINLFLAGTQTAIDAFVTALCADVRFADLQCKYSQSAALPFRRLRVKIKREIITLNQPILKPECERAPAIAPQTLKRWLDRGCDDAGRPLLVLDTRNAFEVAYGAFENSVDYQIGKFTDFPPAVAQNQAALEGKTVVTYCTGGIRCEKAALLMQNRGIKNVFQLDGGILKYFAEVGQHHWRGTCFVFDQRESLDADLVPQKSLAM